MPRARSPERDKAFVLWEQSDGKMLLKEIAEQLGVGETLVRKWKSQDDWEHKRKVTLPNGKGNVTKRKDTSKKKEIEDNQLLVEEVMDNSAMTDKQQLFCLYYVKCFNATKAYRKAYECSYETAAANGYALLRNTTIQEEIRKLKQVRMNQAMLEPEDIFQKYIDIAFADMNDYMQIIDGVAVVNDSAHYDGTLVKKISTGKATTIELVDKMKALEWLAEHLDLATTEQKLKIDKLQSEVARMNEEYDDEVIDDGFIEALQGKVSEVWENDG